MTLPIIIDAQIKHRTLGKMKVRVRDIDLYKFIRLESNRLHYQTSQGATSFQRHEIEWVKAYTY